jgi:hypothetical protein
MPGIAGGSKLSAIASGMARSLGRTAATILDAVSFAPRSAHGLSSANSTAEFD